MKDNGWVIANHSAAHYPVGKDSYFDHFFDEFNECEAVINDKLNMETQFWVLPFEKFAYKTKNMEDALHKPGLANRHLVLVGNEVNKQYDEKENLIYRICFPILSGKKFVKYLENIP